MGMRINQNPSSDETELTCDGKFVASWHRIEIPDEIVGYLNSMLTQAYEHGKHDRSLEIKEAFKKLIG